MRTLSAAALSKISQAKGLEPVNYVAIKWSKGSSFKFYAEKEIYGFNSHLVKLGSLDDVIAGTNKSVEVDVTLADPNGDLKRIIDRVDIHQREVRVYQTFEGLSQSDAFVLFSGRINSPISYDFNSKELTFTVISQIEQTEIGFAPDEGKEFNFVDDDKLGQAWPLGFGTPVHVPGALVRKLGTGQTTRPISMPDTCTLNQLNFELTKAQADLNTLLSAHTAAGLVFTNESLRLADQLSDGEITEQEFNDSINEMLDRRNQETAQYNARRQEILNEVARLQIEWRIERDKEIDYGMNIGHIINGRNFPQNKTVTIEISDAQIRGSFSGDRFTVKNWENPRKAELAQDADPGLSAFVVQQLYLYAIQHNEDNELVWVVWATEYIPTANEFVSSSCYWQADAGSSVKLVSNDREVYVANILRSTVHNVYAYTQQGNLVRVPRGYYNVNYYDIGGGYTVTTVELVRPLASYEGQNWQDGDIYITYTSPVGPNPVNIMIWLIEKYTDFTYDTASFNAARARLAKYPMNFAYLDRRDVMEALNELAFQARCKLVLNDGKFFITYLPVRPTPVDEIGVNEILFDGLELGHVSSEEIVTKLIGEWRSDYAQEVPSLLTVRSNNMRYGIKAEQYDIYAYNNVNLVKKVLDFWAIRLSNPWKQLRLSVPLTALVVESYDFVNLTYNEVANTKVLCEVLSAEYIPDQFQIDLVLQLPVRLGEMNEYKFYYPADLPPKEVWPSKSVLSDPKNEAGFTSPGFVASGESLNLPDSNRSQLSYPDEPTVNFSYQGRPSDNADPSSPTNPIQYLDESTIGFVGIAPRAPAGGVYRPPTTPLEPLNPLELPAITKIDIRKTEIVDSYKSDDHIGTLDTVFQIVQDGQQYRVVIWDKAFVGSFDGSQLGNLNFVVDTLEDGFNVMRPQAAMLGLNPESGEEKTVIDTEVIANKAAHDQANQE